MHAVDEQGTESEPAEEGKYLAPGDRTARAHMRVVCTHRVMPVFSVRSPPAAAPLACVFVNRKCTKVHLCLQRRLGVGVNSKQCSVDVRFRFFV